MSCDITIRIAGEAGQGINVLSNILGKVFVRNGLWSFTNHDIMSRIRGGHNFSQIRVSDSSVKTLSSCVDILVCLDKNSLDLYKDKIGKVIIYDTGKIKENFSCGQKCFGIPLEEISIKIGKSSKMINSVASGVVLALLGLSLDMLFELFNEIFRPKGDEIVNANKNCANEGYNYVQQNYRGEIFCKLITDTKAQKRMLLTGSEAIALGALASNIKFYSGYPMSPSTPIMEYIASKQKDFDLIVEQAEDEISAINMVLGAYFVGVRAMTSTSGGGLALMIEGISLAGMTETPIVIVDAQRPAPATGLPTRTEQGDLLYVLYAGHGEFPRVIFAPSTADQGFYLTNKAFYLAEKYQIPVFILTDQYFNDSLWTIEELNLENINNTSQSILSADDLKNIGSYQYRRYEITDSGISPRILPGTQEQVLYADSDEHNEEGHITESDDVRKRMVDKRLKKFLGLYKEISEPLIYPDKKTDTYIVSWGSTLEIVKEAIRILREKNKNIGYIHFSEIYPLRKDILSDEIIKNSKLISVENNATGQFAKLLKMETGINIDKKILKYDGRPYTPQELVDRIEQL